MDPAPLPSFVLNPDEVQPHVGAASLVTGNSSIPPNAKFLETRPFSPRTSRVAPKLLSGFHSLQAASTASPVKKHWEREMEQNWATGPQPSIVRREALSDPDAYPHRNAHTQSGSAGHGRLLAPRTDPRHENPASLQPRLTSPESHIVQPSPHHSTNVHGYPEVPPGNSYSHAQHFNSTPGSNMPPKRVYGAQGWQAKAFPSSPSALYTVGHQIPWDGERQDKDSTHLYASTSGNDLDIAPELSHGIPISYMSSASGPPTINSSYFEEFSNDIAYGAASSSHHPNGNHSQMITPAGLSTSSPGGISHVSRVSPRGGPRGRSRAPHLITVPTRDEWEAVDAMLMLAMPIGKRRSNQHVLPESLRKYPCTLCPSTFKRRYDLNQHVSAVHLKQQPFKCPECPKSFSHNGTMRKHVRTVHRKEKPFLCGFAGCGLRFSEKGNLNKHLSRKHGPGSAARRRE